jgi:hypothetical protein
MPDEIFSFSMYILIPFFTSIGLFITIFPLVSVMQISACPNICGSFKMRLNDPELGFG